MSELDTTAEAWYQRTHRLRAVWQDDSLPKERREKAFRLWVVMFDRMTKLLPSYIKAHTSRLPLNFPAGGR